MRRFFITSPAFTGEAEVIYDQTGRLILLNMLRTNMTADLVKRFKEKVSAQVDTVAEGFAGTKATIVEVDFEVSFEMFWQKYDKKLNRKRSEGLWNKMSKTDHVKAYYGIDAYLKFLKREDWRSKADPDTYLRNAYWENEYK